MSDIEWSPWVKGDPEPFARFSDIQVDGQCYRIPMEDYKRITGMPEWSEAPEWAQWLAQDLNGHWYWYSHELHKEMTTWDGDYINHRHTDAPMTVLGDWRDTLKERPIDPLDSHPNSELDADQYTVGGDTVEGDGSRGLLDELLGFRTVSLQYDPADVKFDSLSQPDSVNMPSH